jgi:hypothetical protein
VWLARLLVLQTVVSAVLLASLGMATGIELAVGVSLNGLVTLAWCGTWLITAPLSRLGVAFVGCAVLVGLFPLFASNGSRSNSVYLLLLLTFVSSFFLLRTIPDVLPAQLPAWFFTAGVVAASLFVVNLVWSISTGRAGQVSAGLVVASILAFAPNRLPRLLAGAAGLLVLVALLLDTARSASTVVVFVLVFWMMIQPDVARLIRFAASGLLLLATLTYWWFVPTARDRMFGRDAALDIGIAAINVEGRDGVATVLEGDRSVAQSLVGSGVGSASKELQDAGFVLEQPHSEIQRLWFELGALGLVIVCCILGALAWRLYVSARVKDSRRALVLFSLLCSMLIFGAFDNPLSYSWFMVPATVLLAWVLMPIQSRSPRTC